MHWFSRINSLLVWEFKLRQIAVTLVQMQAAYVFVRNISSRRVLAHLCGIWIVIERQRTISIGISHWVNCCELVGKAEWTQWLAFLDNFRFPYWFFLHWIFRPQKVKMIESLGQTCHLMLLLHYVVGSRRVKISVIMLQIRSWVLKLIFWRSSQFTGMLIWIVVPRGVETSCLERILL